MEITINNQIKTISISSLAFLVHDTIGEQTNGIAVAVNQQVIPKKDWENFSLKEKDSVLIIKATQGG